MTSWADEREILNLLFRYCELQDAADFVGVAEMFRHSAYRVHDGDETHVHCGGSCRPCAAGAACEAAPACPAGACDSGKCPAPSCSDGVRDGLETGVDCGWNCPPCASSQQ